MSRSKWRVGLLGAGFIVEAHAKALKSVANAELVAVCDRSRMRAEDAAKSFGIPEVYSSLEEMLRTDIDVVHVLLPPKLHVASAIQALESGRHVFIEKPMGLGASECQALVELAGRKGAKLGVDHNFLFLPSYEKLRRHARDGTLGRLDQVTINWLYPLGLLQSGPFNNWMLQEPGNLFFELGPHLTAFMIDLVGPFERLQAEAFRPVELPGGGLAYRRWHVHGSRGTTAVDLNLSVTPGFADRSVTVRGHAGTARCDFDRDLYYLDQPSGYGMVFDNFLTAMSIARQLSGNAAINLIDAVTGTFRKAPSANPFGKSIERSICAFYETLEGKADPRLDGQFGADVIAACERITQQANYEDVKKVTRAWTTLPPLKSPTILVLGGTGFIGKYLVRALAARGLGIRVATRDASSGRIALAGLPLELVQGDLAEPSFVDACLENIEVVYDLAKAVGTKWEDYYKQDVLVTQNIANRALAKHIKRFIYTGTIASYYSARANDLIASATPLDPEIRSRDHYARAKAVSESFLMDLHREQGFPVVIFRPGVVIGRGSSPAHWGVGMFHSDTRVQFWGDGRNCLPFVLVEDVAEALVLALDAPGIEGKAFLLTDEPLLSGCDYVEALSQAFGTKVRAQETPIWKFYVGDLVKEAAKHLIRHPNRRIPSYRDWDARSLRARFDSSSTRQALGWRPAGSREALIQRGIVEAVRDYMP